MVILASRSSLELLPPLGLAIAVALWTALYGMVFSLFLTGQRRQNASWKFLAQAALMATGAFLLLTYLSPLPNSVRFCSNYQLTQPLIERLSIGGAFFVLGSLYALVPMAVAIFFSTGQRGGNSVILRGSMAGGMFVLLLAPSIFMQCAPFALGVLLGWFGGALIGSIIGGALGLWMRHKFA